MEDVQLDFKLIWNRIEEIANISLFQLGATKVTIGLVLLFIFSVLFLFFFAKKVKKVLVKYILIKYEIDAGISKSIGTIIYYFIISVGFFIIIQTVGIDLSGLSVVAGALSVGIGFGLQNITNNFISGIIILFERPIKEGDWIDVGETRGTVTKISARSTTILTNDNVAVIVPNSDFINSKVTNWSHNDRVVRFKIPIGVSYEEDPVKINELLLQVAKNHKGVLDEPAPAILFSEFADSSLNFILTGHTTDYIDRPGTLKSELNFQIHKIFKDNNIQIPFPQRDLHIKSGDWKEISPVSNS